MKYPPIMGNPETPDDNFIDAILGRADWTEGLEFRTVNGGITLDLPANLSADVRAETLNGDLISDFPLTVSPKPRMSPRSLMAAASAER